MHLTIRLGISLLALGLWAPATSIAVGATGSSNAGECPPEGGVALQVLGSGGPIADDARASSAYLIWVDGKARMLIDAGGGTFLRFAEAHADFLDLDFIGLSHFHADHSADFPALLKSGNFSKRSRPLLVAGPDGSAPFPGLNQFLASLLAKDSGAFAYLGGYLDGTGGLPEITAVEIDSENTGKVAVLGDDGDLIQIEAMHVPHGIVPAVAFRVRINDDVIVFASDQNGNKRAFVEFARDASILVMHMPVPEGVSGVGRRLHAPPGVIGTIAHDAKVKKLLISHLMERSLRNLDENVGIVRSRYSGPVDVASDLRCYEINNQET